MFPLTHFAQMLFRSDLSGASPISPKVVEPLPMRLGAVLNFVTRRVKVRTGCSDSTRRLLLFGALPLVTTLLSSPS